MDTSFDPVIQAAHLRSNLNLDTLSGFTLNLDLKINSESHTNPNRAGFSFITIGQDVTHSIEIAFWDDRVWVYEYNAGVFSKGAEYLIDTTTRRNYRLEVTNQQFTLYVDDIFGINGSLVDYSAFNFPYNLPSTLIFGDDTTSGSSSVEIYSIQTVPLPSTLFLLASGIGFLSFSARVKK